MYKIYAIKGSTTTLIYNDVTPELTTTKLLDPKLSLTDNAAGSFSCKIPQGNNIYDDIEAMTTTIRITRDGDWLWTGRVLTIKKDMWLNKEITAEGALAFFNDVALKQQKWSNTSTQSFVRDVLDIYNAHVPNNRKIYAGAISTSTSSGSGIGNHDYVSEGESPLKHFSTLAEDWGLHMRIREEQENDMPADGPGGKLYLDMLTDTQLPSNTQSIDFGKNLLDYMDETDWSDIITVLHPYGKELDTSTATGDEDYPDKLTIKGKTPSDTNTFAIYDQEYLYNKSAVSHFGRIEETVEWSEVDDADTLIQLSELYLNDYQYYNIKLTVKVVDLHYMTSSVDGFKYLSKVLCKSTPHNLNDEFIIDKMDIPFDKPENTTFSFSRCTMGYYTSDRPTQGYGRGTLSGMTLDVNTFSKASVLNQAKENAMQMIISNTHGYVSLNMDSNNDHVESLSITNQQTMETSTQRWIWTLGGLAYQDRSSINASWNSPNVAITMDGQIVANRITTGTLVVAASGGGTLFSADIDNNTVNIAGFTVKGTALYTGTKSTLASNNNGTYVGNDGLSTSLGSHYIAISEGEIYGYNDGENGYIMFTSTDSSTNRYGLRLAGRGFVGIVTGDWFGVRSSWWSRTASGTCMFDEGCSGSMTYISDIQNIGGGAIQWTYETIQFKHGLLNTTI